MEQLQREHQIKQALVEMRCFRTIVCNFGETSVYPLIAEIARVALITPVSNALPEHGASAVKQIKGCL